MANPDVILSERDQLGLLAYAISDTGYWSVWTEQLPDLFQIESGGIQLYFPPTSPNQPPQTQIAIQFKNPTSINFISRNTATDNFEWVQLLREHKVQPPKCIYEQFSFGNWDWTKLLLKQVINYKTLYGYKLTKIRLSKEPISLVFWCGDIGLSVTAKELKLLNHTGDIALSEIQNINKEWWDYWRNYWDKRNSDNPLPNDPACEMTVPHV